MATSTRPAKPPAIQLIANAVIVDSRRRVLLTRYGDDDQDTWWLPGAELAPFEHPDEALQRALDGLAAAPATLHHIESFRGRRGWHLMFNYLVRADPAAPAADARWFAADALPPFAHGKWEPGVIAKVLSA